jgi:putative ABC transport system permease protein
VLERLFVDVTSAFRALRTTPATTAVAVLTLAVAAGTNLAIFDLIDRALLSPPRFVTDPDRVMTLAFEHTTFDNQRVQMATTSYVTFDAIHGHVPATSNSAAWQSISSSIVVDGEQQQAEALLVSGAYFEWLGARAQIGRALLPDDDRGPSGSPVVVLSHAFWESSFAGDRDVIGRRLTFRGIELTIVGVMPAGFSGHSAARVDVWIPIHAAMRATPGWDRDRFHNIVTIGVRLGPDHNVAAAATQIAAVTGLRAVLTPIRGVEVTRTEHTIAYWLAAVSVLVLVIGLANTATLLLVRGARRRRESSIRVAIGATRGRLVSQIVAESVMLAAASAAAALALSFWLDEAVRRLLLPSLVEATGLTKRTMGGAAIAGACALAVSVLAGAAQLRGLGRPDQPGATGPRGRRARGQTALLLIQTTLAVVLIAGAGMFGRSLYALVAQDLGMRMTDVLLVNFERGPGFVPNQDQIFASALDRIRALPGVTLATPIQILPFTGFQVPPISVPGLAGPPSINGQLPYLTAATPELFDILGLEFVQGRRFTAADETGPPVAIVNESMARTVWPGKSALGQCFRIGFDPSFDPETATGPPAPSPSAPCREVIGVVRNVRQRQVIPSGDETRLMQYYVPFSQSHVAPPFAGPMPHVQGLLLRVTAGADTLAAPIRRLVVDGRTDLPFLRVRPYADLLEPQMRPWRMGTALLLLFSGLALIVSAVGLYAAFAHAVGERRREMAIRIAIGAVPRGVLLMILREAAALAAVGVVFGCVIAAVGGRWIQAMLFGTTATDPIVLGGASIVMLIVAITAVFLPARQAASADPSTLLRVE